MRLFLFVLQNPLYAFKRLVPALQDITLTQHLLHLNITIIAIKQVC